LKGFEKILLEVGETKEVKFQVDESMLSFYDVESKKFKAELGKFIIQIGSSSDDIRIKKEFELVKEN